MSSTEVVEGAIQAYMHCAPRPSSTHRSERYSKSVESSLRVPNSHFSPDQKIRMHCACVATWASVWSSGIDSSTEVRWGEVGWIGGGEYRLAPNPFGHTVWLHPRELDWVCVEATWITSEPNNWILSSGSCAMWLCTESKVHYFVCIIKLLICIVVSCSLLYHIFIYHMGYCAVISCAYCIVVSRSLYTIIVVYRSVNAFYQTALLFPVLYRSFPYSTPVNHIALLRPVGLLNFSWRYCIVVSVMSYIVLHSVLLLFIAFVCRLTVT